MKTKIIIIGGRGTALNVAEQIIDADENYNIGYEIIGFANDVLSSNELNNLPVLCKINEISTFYKYKDIGFIFALYKPDKMQERFALLQNLKLPMEKQINFIHPKSYVSKSVRMGYGNVVLSGSHLHNSVAIGNNNLINSNVVIEHDASLQDFNFLAASCMVGASTVVSNGCFVGLNASIRENISMDEFSFIGMGSVILKNIEKKSSIWYGNPGREK